MMQLVVQVTPKAQNKNKNFAPYSRHVLQHSWMPIFVLGKLLLQVSPGASCNFRRLQKCPMCSQHSQHSQHSQNSGALGSINTFSWCSGVTISRLFLMTIIFQNGTQHTGIGIGIGIVGMHLQISLSWQARMVHASFSAMGKVSWCSLTYPGYSVITPHEGIANHQFLQHHDCWQLPYRRGCILGNTCKYVNLTIALWMSV